MNYTIAEILHVAADKFLASKESEYWLNGGTKEKYSCNAVECSVSKVCKDYISYIPLLDRIYEGLEAMGCPVDSCDAFQNDQNINEENQQARYAWLKFAAMIAEEQGV
jgi:hypothetical protein